MTHIPKFLVQGVEHVPRSPKKKQKQKEAVNFQKNKVIEL